MSKAWERRGTLREQYVCGHPRQVEFGVELECVRCAPGRYLVVAVAVLPGCETENMVDVRFQRAAVADSAGNALMFWLVEGTEPWRTEEGTNGQ